MMKLSSTRIFSIVFVCIFTIAILFISSPAKLEKAYKPCQLPSDIVDSFIHIEGGGFIQGANGMYPEEGPPKKIFVSPFLLQVTEVTNN